MRPQSTVCIAVAAMSEMSSVARADLFTYTAQGRSISAYAIDHIANVNDSHSAAAQGFGPFNTSVSAHAGIGIGNASMNGTLDSSNGVNISSSVSGIGSINQMCEGGGSASYTIAFTLTQPTDATLSYSTFGGSFSLQGPGLSIMAGAAENVGPVALTLGPGDYTFSGGCSLFNHGTGTGVYSAASLVVPAPAGGAVLLLLAGLPAVATRRRRIAR